MTVRERGPLQMLLAALLVVEMVFDVFFQGIHTKALVDAAFNRERSR